MTDKVDTHSDDHVHMRSKSNFFYHNNEEEAKKN